jgi:hypothetical protein
MSDSSFSKIVRVGTVDVGNSRASVFCKIEFDGRRLSISGVEGPLPSGNARGGCGQIDMHLSADSFRTFGPGWSRAKAAEFLRIWGRWHLNDMRAGSPRQRDAIRAMPDKSYDAVKPALEAAGLSPDAEHLHNGKPYAFGSAWLFEAVPAEILDFLRALPDTDRAPAWV